MLRNGFLLATLLLSGFAAERMTAHGQQPLADMATVVFFTPGSHWRGTGSQFKAFVAGKADIMSTGIVYDDKERIALLTHSRYIALQVSPGPHTFSASLSGKHPNPKETVTLDLKPGSVSYLAVTTTSMNYGVGIFMMLTSHIDAATCAEFAEDHAANKSELVDKKRVTARFQTQVDARFDPGNCTP